MAKRNHSKYVGQEVQGWTVISRTVKRYATCMGTHSTFLLEKIVDSNKYTMTLSDREIRLVFNGKSIDETIRGKQSKIQHNLHREAQNTITKETLSYGSI